MPVPEFQLRRTADGSATLHHGSYDALYHSRHGAVQESTHVFIKAGLEQFGEEVDVLEVGLGSGLNFLLTWIRCWEGKCRVRYTALEPFPVPAAILEQLDHCAELAWPGLHEPFMERMADRTAEWLHELGGLRFRQLPSPVQHVEAREEFDLVYFDAFAPATQPELWTPDIFQRMHNALRPGGILVTFCAKGEVRRSMQAAGFVVERLQGPPGKREMLRAKKE